MILKQSTAYSRKFLMVLTSDHISGATGKTVTVELSKGPGAAGTAAAGAVTELDSTNLPGMYQVALTNVDTNTAGDLGFDCTASGCDHTTFIDQVQTTVFTDLLMSAGRPLIANNLEQNATAAIIFPMTNVTTGQRQTGLTVTAQRTLGNAGFGACANAVTEIGTTGIYYLALAAGDTNAASVAILLTAPGANDLLVPLIPTN